MNTQRALLIAGLSSIALATPAMAQDGSAFTGPRIEGIIGYDSVRPGSTTDIDNADDIDQSIDDVAYGVGVGYDFAVGGAVLGLEGEWIESEAKTNYNTTNLTNFGVSNIDAGRDLYVGVRAGVPVTPSTLLYAKGGYTNARMNVLATDNTTDVGTNVDLDGWRLGAGVEQQFGQNFFGKVEYRYSNYGKGQFTAPSGAASDRFDVDLDRHQVMLGLGYRF
ncbi:porin family protein [Aurantiacibacter xanthus]|uniref:Porin family protein n=1 Tax=Aurantiacibacter xanthus TaxID=1784712 RepID=A0A3A1P6Z0_9SPHN|nr:outer membrane beta-barrel protein [Aurantiacibacter xanthus]RIV88670.1 porin family protein [Aurantiacibacter xanthus]